MLVIFTRLLSCRVDHLIAGQQRPSVDLVPGDIVSLLDPPLQIFPADMILLFGDAIDAEGGAKSQAKTPWEGDVLLNFDALVSLFSQSPIARRLDRVVYRNIVNNRCFCRET